MSLTPQLRLKVAGGLGMPLQGRKLWVETQPASLIQKAAVRGQLCGMFAIVRVAILTVRRLGIPRFNRRNSDQPIPILDCPISWRACGLAVLEQERKTQLHALKIENFLFALPTIEKQQTTKKIAP